jgi:hypothetical protein
MMITQIVTFRSWRDNRHFPSSTSSVTAVITITVWEAFGSADDVEPIMTGLFDLETKFESLCFSRIGSLYFKEDVSADLQTVPLLTESIDAATWELSERYRVGPLINFQWWRGERAHMPLERGPCMVCLPSVILFH